MTDLNKIVGQMTADEKIAQLTGFIMPYLYSYADPAKGAAGGMSIDAGKLAQLRPHGLGHLSLAWFHKAGEDDYRAVLKSVQDKAREISRFGIGVLIHAEGISGLVHGTGIPFPTAWAQAAAWMPGLVERSAAVTAAQMRDYGISLCFSPVLDLARDPRWGRVHETYGEDQELAAQTGVAFVRGINGRDLDSGVVATGKHFLGYALSEGGHNQAKTSAGRRALTDEYAVPFRRAIREAGLSAVMNSYNEIDGIPAAANAWLLTDLLRGQLGFDGLVVSDYDAVGMLIRPYHVALEPKDAAALALNAGLDVELPGDGNFAELGKALADGSLSEATVDQAVTRVLELKREAGLVPGAAPRRPHRPAAAPDRAEAAALAREIAVNAAVLLQNDGTLPLRPGTRIAVAGCLADDLRIHFGAYTDVANDEQPVAMKMIRSGQVPGIDPKTYNFTDMFQTRMPGIEPAFERAARDLYPGAPTILGALTAAGHDVTFAATGSPDTTGPLDLDALDAAVSAADVVVAVVGERTGWVGNNTAGEGQTSARLELPGNQPQLIEALRRHAVPLVTVVVSGRPLILTSVAEVSAAVLLAPLLGGGAPAVIADVLTGAAEPGGRLPSTFPRHVGQIPLYHGHPFGSGYGHPTGSRHPYNDLDPAPLYPFGHGLGYTSFDMQLGEVSVDEDAGVITAATRVTNTGARPGSTVIQLYARDEHGTVVRPVRQLVAFQRVRLEAGETAEQELAFPVERLYYTLPGGHRGIEAGDITVMAASSSSDVAAQATVRVNGR
jgi:beta-glucosidase